MKSVKIPPAYMVRPKDCRRGMGPVFDKRVCIDSLICHYYCKDKCQEYVNYDQARQEKRR